MEKYFQILNDAVFEMITKRRKERESNSAPESRTLLDILIEAKDHEGDGRGFSDVEVQNI